MKQTSYQMVYDCLREHADVNLEGLYSGSQVKWYEHSQRDFSLDIELVERVMKQVEPGLTVELASGGGRIARRVAHLTQKYLALDKSQSMISELIDRCSKESIANVHGQIFDFNSRSDQVACGMSADLVLLMNNSIFYSDNAEGCLHVMQMAARMLKRDGHFLIDWSPSSPGGSGGSLLSMSLIHGEQGEDRIQIINPVFDPVTRNRRLHFVNIDLSKNDQPKLSYCEHSQYIPSIGEILLAAKIAEFQIVSQYSDYEQLDPGEGFRGSQYAILFRKV